MVADNEEAATLDVVAIVEKQKVDTAKAALNVVTITLTGKKIPTSVAGTVVPDAIPVLQQADVVASEVEATANESKKKKPKVTKGGPTRASQRAKPGNPPN